MIPGMTQPPFRSMPSAPAGTESPFPTITIFVPWIRMSPPGMVSALTVMTWPFLKRTGFSAAGSRPDRPRMRAAVDMDLTAVVSFIFFLLSRDAFGRELGGTGPSLDHRAPPPFPFHGGREEKVDVLAGPRDGDLDGDIFSCDYAAGAV